MGDIELERQRQMVSELARSWWAKRADDEIECAAAAKQAPSTAQEPAPVPPALVQYADPEAEVDDWNGKVTPSLDRYGRPTRSNQRSPGRSYPRYS